MINFKNIDAEDIACLLAILIGGIFAIVNPERIGDAFEHTVIGIILIKIFW